MSPPTPSPREIVRSVCSVKKARAGLIPESDATDAEANVQLIAHAPALRTQLERVVMVAEKLLVYHPDAVQARLAHGMIEQARALLAEIDQAQMEEGTP